MPFPGRTETYVATLAHVRLAAASELVPARAAHFSQVTRQANGYWSGPAMRPSVDQPPTRDG